MMFADYEFFKKLVGLRSRRFRNAGEDSTAGFNGLWKALRHEFATFGVPNDFCSDGGPEFTAEETENISHLPISLNQMDM